MDIQAHDVARLVAQRGEQTIPLTHYTGILLLHAMARLAVRTDDAPALNHVRELLRPFLRGERDFKCNFPNYRCGGNASAWLLQQGLLPEAAEPVRRYAEEILHEANRTQDGILTQPSADPAAGKVWIDVAFAVTPFLLFAGLALKNEAYIDEGFDQTLRMVELLRNRDTGLLHQSRGFNGAGNFSQDHWSRGNGWGMIALTELVQYLPKDSKHRPAAEAMFRDLCAACLRVQDANGMWHQEMTDHGSYPETSGTGLLLYGIGVGVECGLLGAEYRAALEKGLSGCRRFIALDGSVHNTCKGCLCPGDGSKAAYAAHPWVLNDCHAFGALVLAFGEGSGTGKLE